MAGPALASEKELIPRLGTEDSFANWKFRLKTLMEEKQVWGVIKLETELTPEDSRKDARAKNLIVQCISDKYLEIVKKCNTAREMIIKLEQTFERKSIVNKLHLKRKLITLKCGKNEKLQDFFLKFDSLLNQLTAAGCPVDEMDKTCYLLSSLPPQFDTVITSIETLITDNSTIDTDFVKARLLDAEVKEQTSNGEQQPQAAFLTCYQCGRPGHKAVHCRGPSRGQSTRGRGFVRQTSGQQQYVRGRGRARGPYRGSGHIQHGSSATTNDCDETQFFVLSANLLTSFVLGFMLAFPSVLNPAIISNNSTDVKTTRDHASWISSINGFGGMMGSFILSSILHIRGRKAYFYTKNLCLFIGWIIIPLAQDIPALYAARFIQGISSGGNYINGIIIGEYVHPSRRGYFITLKKVVNAIGVLCCHVMGSFWTWRQIAIFAAVFPLLALLMTYFWPESPSHLATKEKFEDSEKSFNWLNGNSAETQKQFKSFIDGQRDKIAKNRMEKNSVAGLAKKFVKKDFQKPFIITIVLTVSVDVSGKYYYSAYMLQIMTEVIGNNKLAVYFTLWTDLLTIVAVSASTIVIIYVKRRTLLFYSGFTLVCSMWLISILVYLKSIYTFSTPAVWFIALVIILQSLIANIGVVPVAFVFVGEIFPLEHKGLGAFTSCFVFTCLYAIVFKVIPVLMEHTKLYGIYGIFGVILAVCMIILYNIVPETKDKTLQEIEDDLKNVPSKDMTSMEGEKLMRIDEKKI